MDTQDLTTPAENIEQHVENIETPENASANSESVSEKQSNPTEAATEAASEVTPTQPAVAEEAEAPAAEDAEEPEAPATPLDELSKEELLERLKAISELEADAISREGVARIKSIFNAIRAKEVAAERQAFVEAGNDEAAFEATADETETAFRELLDNIKEKKSAMQAQQEAERADNLAKKNAIIAELIEMAADTDNVNRHFQRAKELQQEFKGIGEVPPTDASDVWKRYQDACERYYDQLKINKDLRDYDFRKNLDTKQLLCQTAEDLINEEDVIVAFRRLQDLHDKWRETGPVAKEVREEIWTRFKDASAAINKKYQAYFEERKARERENELAKTEICERVEALDFSDLKTYAAWDEMTKEILKAQEDWKKLGFASKKMNNALFARFRETCDKFFAAKAEHFKSMKEELSDNLAKKIALCEKAEALKDSTEWRKTTDELVKLQKEWKTIGTVAKKHSDAVWHRFQAACDYFFEQKKAQTSGVRQAEQANLKAKKEIIAALKEIDPETVERSEAVAKVRELTAKWQEIGHVPFRDKDKVYDAYREVTNKLFRALDIRQTRESMERFERTLKDMDGDEIRMLRERERMIRAYEQRRSELKTYENNLGFLSSKSKSGDSMVRELERKMERIREDLKVLEEKIKVIDQKL